MIFRADILAAMYRGLITTIDSGRLTFPALMLRRKIDKDRRAVVVGHLACSLCDSRNTDFAVSWHANAGPRKAHSPQ